MVAYKGGHQLEKVLNIREASNLLGVTETTLRKYCRENKIESKNIGGKWYILPENLLKFVTPQKSIEE